MRILNVTETYAPFLEFGGPPVKSGPWPKAWPAVVIPSMS